MRYEKQINEYFNEFECYYFQNFQACIDVICDPLKYFPKGARFLINFYIFNYRKLIIIFLPAKLEKYLERLNHPKIYFTIG